eukprot:CAMPEP_0115146764 /NCGR_PEP_ID=MMETSP0227-20121206/62899_1 /TAXON_ID=89957 /ORGANISM="Polarella glacialis, Strain CCMP 1383" /LENGTH=80 /DNA_ID=CAMNT_0002556523 /DNA_START=43 /DNA_END=283 /DNA_ORIENTATION=+
MTLGPVGRLDPTYVLVLSGLSLTGGGVDIDVYPSLSLAPAAGRPIASIAGSVWNSNLEAFKPLLVSGESWKKTSQPITSE